MSLLLPGTDDYPGEVFKCWSSVTDVETRERLTQECGSTIKPRKGQPPQRSTGTELTACKPGGYSGNYKLKFFVDFALKNQYIGTMCLGRIWWLSPKDDNAVILKS